MAKNLKLIPDPELDQLVRELNQTNAAENFGEPENEDEAAPPGPAAPAPAAGPTPRRRARPDGGDAEDVTPLPPGLHRRPPGGGARPPARAMADRLHHGEGPRNNSRADQPQRGPAHQHHLRPQRVRAP